jgi:hypothetical protein
MTFIPGNNANPKGRPKKPVDYRSALMQETCYKHRRDIKKVAKIAFNEAKKGIPWAVKLCMEYFFPKPGTFVSVSTDEKKEVRILAANFVQSLTEDERRTFMQLYLKGQQPMKAVTTIDSPAEPKATE